MKKAPLASLFSCLVQEGDSGVSQSHGWGWWGCRDGVERRRRWGIIQREKNSFLIINFSALECDMLIHCEASNLGDKGPDNTSCARLGWRSEPRQGGSI